MLFRIMVVATIAQLRDFEARLGVLFAHNPEWKLRMVEDSVEGIFYELTDYSAKNYTLSDVIDDVTLIGVFGALHAECSEWRVSAYVAQHHVTHSDEKGLEVVHDNYISGGYHWQ